MSNQPPSLLYFDGKLIKDQPSLVEVIDQYMVNQFTVEMVAQQLWDARLTPDPNLFGDALMEREPVVASLVQYKEAPSQRVTSVVAELPKVETEILAVAANAIFGGELGDHFVLNEGRSLKINYENPPSLEQGYEMVGRIFKTDEMAGKLKNYSSWLLGMALDEMERFFGEAFDISTLVESTGKVYNTLITSLNVYRAFADKQYNIPFTAHKEVFYSTLDDQDKHWLLQKAEDKQMSCAELRVIKNYMVKNGADSITDEDIEHPAALVQTINERSKTPEFMFKLGEETVVAKVPFEDIPLHATEIINITRRSKVENGEEKRLGIWIDGEVKHIQSNKRIRHLPRIDDIPIIAIPMEAVESTQEGGSPPPPTIVIPSL